MLSQLVHAHFITARPKSQEPKSAEEYELAIMPSEPHSSPSPFPSAYPSRASSQTSSSNTSMYSVSTHSTTSTTSLDAPSFDAPTSKSQTSRSSSPTSSTEIDMMERENVDLTDRSALRPVQHSKLLLRAIRYIQSHITPPMPATPVLRPTHDGKAMLEVLDWHLEG